MVAASHCHLTHCISSGITLACHGISRQEQPSVLISALNWVSTSLWIARRHVGSKNAVNNALGAQAGHTQLPLKSTFHLLWPFLIFLTFRGFNTKVPRAVKALRSSFLALSKGPSWLCKCSYNICTRVKKKGQKRCVQEENNETMRPMTMRHIARALHTFGTQKHPLHVIHEKKEERIKEWFQVFRSLWHLLLFLLFFFCRLQPSSQSPLQ